MSKRKYSKMDKRAKDKLVRSPGENGGGQDAQKDLFTQELEGMRQRKRPQERMERNLQALRVRRWRKLVMDRKKWKDIV